MNKYFKRYTMLPAAIFFAANCMSQTNSLEDSNGVAVIKDARIDLLVKKQAQINKVSVYKNSRGEYKGFRIMIMNTNSRDIAYKTRADILRNFPDYNVYMAYQTPYYKIKMGDFLKRADAEKLKKDMMVIFKQGMFVVQDIIKLTPEEEKRLIEESEKANTD